MLHDETRKLLIETWNKTHNAKEIAERFVEYLKTKLLPPLSEADIIAMDNMRSHHAKAVKQLLDSSKVTYLYLPPYSPDLNPIEKMWSKMKSFLRKRKVRVAAELPDAVKAALETISTNDCKGGFTHLEFALIKRIAIDIKVLLNNPG